MNELQFYNQLFSQVSLFTNPLSEDPRTNKVHVTQFSFTRKSKKKGQCVDICFTRIEATNGGCGVSVDVPLSLTETEDYCRNAKGLNLLGYLHDIECNLAYRIDLVQQKDGGFWSHLIEQSTDNENLWLLPNGAKIQKVYLEKVLAFFESIHANQVEMIMGKDPYYPVYFSQSDRYDPDSPCASAVIAPVYLSESREYSLA